MQDTKSWPLSFGAEQAIDFTADALGVSILPVREGEPPRLELSGRDVSALDVEIGESSNVLRVQVRRLDSFLNWLGNWDVRATLHVPPTVRGRFRTSAGQVEARDLGPCALDINTDAGKVKLQDVYGRLHLATSAGKIDADRIGGIVEVETEAGAADLKIVQLEPGQHRVRTSVGAAKIELAPGLDVRIDARATIGSVRNEYPSSPNAAATLTVTSEVGSVQIREGGRPAEWWSGVPSAAADASTWANRPAPPVPPAPPTPAAPPPPPATPGQPASNQPVQRAADAGGEDAMMRILKQVESGQLSASEANERLRRLGGS